MIRQPVQFSQVLSVTTGNWWELAMCSSNWMVLTWQWAEWLGTKSSFCKTCFGHLRMHQPCSSPITHCQDSKIEYGSCSRNTEWKRPQIATRNPFRLTNPRCQWMIACLLQRMSRETHAKMYAISRKLQKKEELHCSRTMASIGP